MDSTPEKLLVLNMNQAGGAMTDPILGNHGVVSGGLERQLAGISTGSSFSAAGNGVDGAVTVANHTRFQQRSDGSLITSFSVSFFAQRDADPAVGQKMVMAAKDAGAPVGGWSIEAYNDAGTVKLRAYIKGSDGVVWIGSQTGVVPLAAETAYRIALTYDGGNARVWVNDGPAKATMAIRGAGLSNNDSPVQVFSYHGGLAAFNGIIDDFVLWDGELTQTHVEALDDPVTITHGEPAAAFSCPSRPGATVTTTHRNLGAISTECGLTKGGAVSYDCTGTQVNITWDGLTDTTPHPISGFRFGIDHNGACMAGGAVFGNLDPAAQWGPVYPTNAGGVAVLIGSSGGASESIQNILVEGVRAHRIWEGIRCTWTNPRPNFITIRGSWFSDIHDDCIENDQLRTLHVDDCLMDGVFSGISTDNTGSVPSGTVVTMNGLLMRLRPMGAGGALQGPGLNPGHKEFVKPGRGGNPIPHDITNCVFAVQQMANVPAGGGDPQGNPFRRLMVDGTVRAWRNNTICWLGAGAYPWTATLPSGTTVLTGISAANFWNSARSTWITNHPLVRRFGSPHDDGFPIS